MGPTKNGSAARRARPVPAGGDGRGAGIRLRDDQAAARPRPCDRGEGSIYRLLGRLERDGLVETYRAASNGGPPRKYDRPSGAGRLALAVGVSEWRAARDAVDAVLATSRWRWLHERFRRAVPQGVEAPRCPRSARRGDGSRPGRPTSRKPRPKASPPRSTSGAVSSIHGRSLPPGRPSEGSSHHRQARERRPEIARPRGVHRPCSDHTDRCSAAARDRTTYGDTLVQDNRTSPSIATTGPLRTVWPRLASSPRKPIRPGRVDPALFRDRRARIRGMAVVEVGPLPTPTAPA